jgi:hypothetical protein
VQAWDQITSGDDGITDGVRSKGRSVGVVKWVAQSAEPQSRLAGGKIGDFRPRILREDLDADFGGSAV